MELLTLPGELIIQILCHLPPSELLTCSLTCRYLNHTITTSTLIRYHTFLRLTQYKHNPSSSLNLAERLEALKKRDDAWRFLRPDFIEKVEVKHYPSGIYDLTAGIYLLGGDPRNTLHWIELPDHKRDAVEWQSLEIQKTIVDMGLCLYEHDLLVIITTSPKPTDSGFNSIEAHFFQFSTSEPHPLAKANPFLIHDYLSRFFKPAIGIEIVGDHLVLILTMYDSQEEDRVYIYHWPEGRLLANFVAPNGTYSGLVFLRDGLFLLPNTHENRLEIFEIPKDGGMATATCTLMLPELAEGRSVGNISCRSEPNPVGSNSTHLHTQTPFYTNPPDAIIIFNLVVQRDPGTPPAEVQPDHALTCFVHRRSMLNEYTKYSESGNTTPIPWPLWGPPITRWFNAENFPTRWITTTAGQRAVLIADSAPEHGFPYVVLDFNQDNVARMSRWMELVEWEARQNAWDEPLDFLPQGHGSERNPLYATSPSRSSHPNGVGQASSSSSSSASASSSVASSSSTHTLAEQAKNQRVLKKLKRRQRRLDRDYIWVVEDPDQLEPFEIFANPPVGGRLPYTACSSKDPCSWNGVLMDEERLLGITTDEEDRVMKIDVVHFG